MVKKKTEDESVVYVSAANVTLHLDVDPNDPRNVAPTPALPSLNDEDQN